MSYRGLATYRGPNGTYHADSCAPLKAAAARRAVELYAYGREAYPGSPIEPGTLAHLRSVGLWDIKTDQNWGLPWHRNEGIEVSCVTHGRLEFSCDEEDYELAPGSVTITRPWQPHRVGRPNVGPSRLCWFIIDVGVRRPNQQWNWPAWLLLPESELNRITELLRRNEHPVWQATPALARAIDRLQAALRQEVSQPLARIGLSIAEILIELSDLLEQRSWAGDPYLTSTARVVEMFLGQLSQQLDEQWTLGTMAAACGLGKTSFVEHCRELVNMSPTEYLKSLRVARATYLLEKSDEKITDIAIGCGFQSSQYFSTSFKEAVGCTPSERRAAARERRMSQVAFSATCAL